MNEKKFLTRGTVLLATIILVVIIIIFIVIKSLSNNSVKNYKQFEQELIIAAENYYTIKDMDLDDGEEKKITIKELNDMNLVYNENSKKCSGYVVISSEEDISTEQYDIVYRAYIKCGNKYMTANYSEY